MHNLVYLIGRLTDDPKLKKCKNNQDSLSINLAVQRSFKNEDGIYEVDYIKCELFNITALRTSEYCKKGDLVGIRGRLQTRRYEDNGETKYITEVVVDKVSFLASKKDNNNNEEELAE